MMNSARILHAAMAVGLIAGASAHANAGELIVDAAVNVASTMPIYQSATVAANQAVISEQLRLRSSGLIASRTYGDLGLQQTAIEIGASNQIIGADVPLALGF